MGALVVNGTMTVAGLVAGVMLLRELAQMPNKAHSTLICFGPVPHVMLHRHHHHPSHWRHHRHQATLHHCLVCLHACVI